MTNLFDQQFAPDELTVKVTELLVATADSTDAMIDNTVTQVLRLVRDRMHMDVVFVSEFTDGRRVFRQVANPPGHPVVAPGESDPLEESWCQRVVDGRIPEMVPDTSKNPATAQLHARVPIGAHMSTPIVLKDGRVYGTLCGFNAKPTDLWTVHDLKNLQYTAQLVASKLDRQYSLEKQAAAASNWSVLQQNPDTLNG
jgi:GAF domain-containing protein